MPTLNSREHRAAQERSVLAAEHHRRGEVEKARVLFREAADLELRAVQAVPASAARTRSALAVSAVAMLYKAGEFERAEVVAREWLASEMLLPTAQMQLAEILDAAYEARCNGDGARSNDPSSRRLTQPWMSKRMITKHI